MKQCRFDYGNTSTDVTHVTRAREKQIPGLIEWATATISPYNAINAGAVRRQRHKLHV